MNLFIFIKHTDLLLKETLNTIYFYLNGEDKRINFLKKVFQNNAELNIENGNKAK